MARRSASSVSERAFRKVLADQLPMHPEINEKYARAWWKRMQARLVAELHGPEDLTEAERQRRIQRQHLLMPFELAATIPKLYATEHVPLDQKIIHAKLFNAFGAGTWLIAEYDPEEELVFCYVLGLGGDEWGYTSLRELETLPAHMGRREISGVPSIERDLYFTPGPFREVMLRESPSAAKEMEVRSQEVEPPPDERPTPQEVTTHPPAPSWVRGQTIPTLGEVLGAIEDADGDQDQARTALSLRYPRWGDDYAEAEDDLRQGVEKYRYNLEEWKLAHQGTSMMSPSAPGQVVRRIKLLQPKLNKQNYWKDYVRQLPGGEEEGYDLVTAEVEQTLGLSVEQYDQLVESLMEDRPQWFDGRKGGGGSDFPIPPQYANAHPSSMPDELYRKWIDQAYGYVTEIKAPGRRTFFVNPEGHLYARYVLFPEGTTSSWTPTIGAEPAPAPEPSSTSIAADALDPSTIHRGDRVLLPDGRVGTVDSINVYRTRKAKIIPTREGVEAREVQEERHFAIMVHTDDGNAVRWESDSDAPLRRGPPRPGQGDPIPNDQVQEGMRVAMLDGSHGVVSKAETARITMTPVFGGQSESSTHYTFEVKLDSGRTERTYSGLYHEVGPPPQVVPDVPDGSGGFVSPKSAWQAIEDTKRRIKKYQEKEQRARKPSAKQEWATLIQREKDDLVRRIERWVSWRRENQDANVPGVDALSERKMELQNKRFRVGHEDWELEQLRKAPHDWKTRWKVGDGVWIYIADAGGMAANRGWRIQAIEGNDAILSSGAGRPIRSKLWMLHAEHAGDAPAIRPGPGVYLHPESGPASQRLGDTEGDECREVEFDLGGKHIQVKCGARGRRDTWHNIYVGRERYGWNGSRWGRGARPSSEVLQAIREHGVTAFPER